MIMATLDSLQPEILRQFSVSQLRDELQGRSLGAAGTKDELIQRLVADNLLHHDNNTLSSLAEQRLQRSQVSEQLSVAETEIAALRSQILEMQSRESSQSGFSSESPHEQDNISNPTPQLDIQNAVANLTATVQQLAQLQLTAFQQNSISQNPPPPVIQFTSTMDTAQAIPYFSGKPLENAKDWLTQVERIASHALWSSSLTLINAQTRLKSSAADWNAVYGKKCNDWESWKFAFEQRFKKRMGMKEFLEYQAQRVLQDNETLVSYIYAKDAILENSPLPLDVEERISLILGDIQDDRWANPLVIHNYQNVSELIDRATALDSRRRLSTKRNVPFRSPHSFEKENAEFPRSSAKVGNFMKKYNPQTDRPDDCHCWRCGHFGHISSQCHLPPPSATGNNQIAKPSSTSSTRPKQTTNRASSNSTSAPQPITTSASTNRYNSVNCIKATSTDSPLVSAIVNGETNIEALCDPGSSVTLMEARFVPQNATVFPWQDGPLGVADGYITPSGWITLRIQVGNIDYIMPKVGLCSKLPVSLILGTDWKTSVHASFLFAADNSFCITTPSSMQYFNCASAQSPSVNCIRPQRSNVNGSSNTANVVKINDTVTSDSLPSTKISIDVPDSTEKSSTILSPAQQTEINALLTEYDDVFSTPNSIGLCPDIELTIPLQHDRPIRCKPYRLPEPHRLHLHQQITEWIEQDICRVSNSKYAAPAFVVEQPFHNTTPLRTVIDYSRTINPITVRDPQPVDNMDDVLNRIAGKKYMSKVDIKSAYLHIKVNSDDVHKTAFVTPDGHFEFLRMAFGLSDGPATLAKAIKKTYASLLDQGFAPYFDDLSLAHNDFDEHLRCLRLFFECTRKSGFKLSHSKCLFAVSQIPLLGRIVTSFGIIPDPQRTAVVTRYTSLHSIREVRSFLGFANTLRKHIKGFAKLAKPLSDLLKGTSTSRPYENDKSFTLTSEQQAAFEELKRCVTSPPALAFFRHGLPTFLETDASYNGLGACLLQEHEGKRYIIEYASRTLSPPETRYHSNELECTAVHWAITVKFRLYLLGQKFTLITDNYTTAYVISKGRINRKFARHIVDLSQFDFDTQHRAGKQNTLADHLSRYPAADSRKCLAVSLTTTSSLLDAQSRDAFCSYVISQLAKPANTNHLRQFHDSYKIENGLLLHKHFRDTDVWTIILPFSHRTAALRLCHDDAGHLNLQKTLAHLRSRYWWPKLLQKTKEYVRSCDICQRTNRRTILANGLLGDRPLPSTPFEVISGDHVVCLPQTAAGNTSMLVNIDHTTRFVLARASSSLSAYSVTEILDNDIILRYGPPLIYISDCGPAFTARHTQRFFKKYGIDHRSTPPYTPQANGLVERANGTLVTILKKLAHREPNTWDKFLPNALLAINTATQSSSKQSPFFLLHGFQPRLPKELHLGTILNDMPRDEQLQMLAPFRNAALDNLENAHTDNKRRYDVKRLDRHFEVGDLVLYDWPQAKDNKLTSKFKGPFRILRPVGAVCYEIADIENETTRKLVHIQHLKPYRQRTKTINEKKKRITQQTSAPLNRPLENNSPAKTTEQIISARPQRTRRQPDRYGTYVSH